MKIAIIGAGAMGCLFGGRLAATSDVCLYDVNQTHVEEIQKNGLLMTSGDERIVVPVRATTDPSEIGIVDAAIFFTKYTFMESAVKDALHCIGSKTVVLTLQNGIGCTEILRKFIPEKQICYGMTAYTSDMKGPGHIELTTKESVGTYFWPMNGCVTPAQQNLAQSMRQAGFAVEISREVDQKIWRKLMINCSQNTLCSILRLRVGVLMHTPESAELLKKVVGEVAAVATAKGIDLTYEEGMRYVSEVSGAVEHHLPSMALDVEKHRKTEIACLNEAVVAEGRRLGVSTPTLETIALLVRAIELNYENQAF